MLTDAFCPLLVINLMHCFTVRSTNSAKIQSEPVFPPRVPPADLSSPLWIICEYLSTAFVNDSYMYSFFKLTVENDGDVLTDVGGWCDVQRKIPVVVCWFGSPTTGPSTIATTASRFWCHFCSWLMFFMF